MDLVQSVRVEDLEPEDLILFFDVPSERVYARTVVWIQGYRPGSELLVIKLGVFGDLVLGPHEPVLRLRREVNGDK